MSGAYNQAQRNLTLKIMSAFSTLMILIIFASITICAITVGRVFSYNKKYHLPESKYTRLFGFLTKEHFVGFYILFVLLDMLAGVWFIMNI